MILLIVAGSLMIALVCSLVASQVITPYIPLISPEPVVTGFIGYYAGLFCFLIVPLLLIGKWMINFAFGYRSTHRFRKTIAGFWIVSFVAFAGTVAFTARNFAAKAEKQDAVITSSIDTSQALLVNLNELEIEDEWARVMIGPARLSKGKLYANDIAVEVKFLPNIDSQELLINKTTSSYGRSKSSARWNTSEPNHNITFADSTLDIDRFYFINRGGKFRVQEIKYDVELPIGAKVRFTKNGQLGMHRMFHTVYDTDATYRMTSKGLKSMAAK